MLKITNDISLLPYNTFHIDVRAHQMMEYDSVDDLKSAIAMFDGRLPLLHIGGGSNLLFLSDFDGIVLHSCIRDWQVVHEDDTQLLVRVGSGYVFDDFVGLCVQHGWHGMENLSLIPGEVGASAVQNIGAYGVEACDCIVSVECIDLHTAEARTFTNEECQYGYRQSIFKQDGMRGRYAVTYVTYRLQKQFTPQLDYGGIRRVLEQKGIDAARVDAATLRDVIVGIRREKLPDPKVTGNAGSFFVNPVVGVQKYRELAAQYPDMPHYVVDDEHIKIPAGWMIDQCGWKGRSLGPAGVHPRQALVLVNNGGACGADIVALCDAVRASVQERFGIDIHPEVNFI